MIIIVCGALAAFAFLLLMKVLWTKANVSLKPSANVIIIGTVVLVGALGVLMASGRLHWLMAAGTAVLPFLRRGFGLLRLAPMLANAWRLFGGGQPFSSPFRQPGFTARSESAPNISEAKTDDLNIRLDHKTGEMSGGVLAGKFNGRTLESLTEAEIVDFYNSVSDDSKRLLSAYIQRYHPNLSTASTGDQSAGAGSSTPELSVERARKILGVSANATKDEVIAAHRRLMQKNHPDRGGSEFLATEINQAKAVLLAQY